ncbi:hypothetical protein, partial [Xanthomonas vasicola]|uniref:hypothetical protein n=1 Tax=Xanthomonas vasicola TaxID=56459 RepID=UPI001C9526FD
MEAPFYPVTSCLQKRNRILRVIFTRMSAEPRGEQLGRPGGFVAVERHSGPFDNSQQDVAHWYLVSMG